MATKRSIVVRKRPVKRAQLSKGHTDQSSGLVRIDYERVKQVSGVVNLTNVLLMRSQWETLARAARGNVPAGSMSYTQHLSQAGWDFDAARTSLEVTIEYQVTAFAELPKKRIPLFALACELAVMFGVPDDFKPADADVMADFAVANGQLNAFPYFRQHVQDMTARAGWPPLVLPTFRIPASRQRSIGLKASR